MSEPIRVLIADDHPIVRKGLVQTLAETGEITVVGEAADGRAALERLQALSPDIAILDIRMPGLDGLAVLRAARDKGLTTKVIFLTIEREEELFEAAMRAGASGYVLKEAAGDDLVPAVHAVLDGGRFVSRVIGYVPSVDDEE